MRKFSKKYGVVTFLVIFVILIISCLIFLPSNVKYDDSVLSVDYVGEKELVVSNVLPITDVVGKVINSESNKIGVTGYLEFEIKSNVEEKVEYEIYLTKDDLVDEVPVKFVKVYMTDYNDVPLKGFNESGVPTYYDLRLSSNDPSGKLLYSGFLKDGQSHKFKLRMWVADTYQLSLNEKEFAAKLNVKVK